MARKYSPQEVWDNYITKLIGDIRSNNVKNKKDINSFLTKNNYVKESNAYIKSLVGETVRTDNISVPETVNRLHVKINSNLRSLNKKLSDIDSGNYGSTMRFLRSYERQLRQRAREISDPTELKRTKADISRMQTIRKNIRKADTKVLPNVLKQSLNSVNDIQFSKSIRSSLNMQVKAVAISEQTKVAAEKFLEKDTGTKLIDIKLAASHTVYDICDEMAAAGPYTSDDLPTLPLHPYCKCRYVYHK
jgi:hypothetical protein